jgi:hypothetical protein
MVAANPKYRIPFAAAKPVPPVKQLAERVRQYFVRHPEVSREEFLVEAVRREIAFREQREIENAAGPAPTLTAEDIRIHACLVERLAVVYYEQHGLWPKLRRFLFGNRLVRWLRRYNQPHCGRNQARLRKGENKYGTDS